MGDPIPKSDGAQARDPEGQDLALGLGKEAREGGSEEMGFHSPLQPMDEMWARVWMSVQQGKWRVTSQSSPVSQQAPSEGTTARGLLRGAYPLAVDLPSQVSAPEGKASAEKKRASWAVRQAKGNALEGKDRVTGS